MLFARPAGMGPDPTPWLLLTAGWLLVSWLLPLALIDLDTLLLPEPLCRWGLLLGLAASAFIVWMIRSHPSQKLFCFAVTMIMGGALGNVIDRLLHGHVVDFLQFRFAILEPLFPGGYFPSFNVADSAITLGAACVILDEILRVRRSR